MFDNTKILLYKLFVRYLVVKLACANAVGKRKEGKIISAAFLLH